MDQIISAFQHRSNILFFYSPYNFIRSIPFEKNIEIVKRSIFDDHLLRFDATVNGKTVFYFYQQLPWDTGFFSINTFKLSYVLYDNVSFEELGQTSLQFADMLRRQGKCYCFIEIPSEDIFCIQALNVAGFKLIETRLTYFRGQLEDFSNERYSVRPADLSDTENLKRVAREMRNDYDRFHADAVFDQKDADEFLAKYIEESIKGFADLVLIPAEQGLPSDSFLTARYFKADWEQLGVNVSKMVLSAVSGTTNRGWYKKLISEMTYALKEEGAQYIFMNTQSTNRAVFYTWESLGYRLGSTTHVLSIDFK